MAYIDRDLLLKDIEESVVFTVSRGQRNSPEIRGANKVIDQIKQMPTADVVEVVRCKDCVHYNDGHCIEFPISGDAWAYAETKPNDFCSYGERKTEHSYCTDKQNHLRHCEDCHEGGCD